MVVSTWNTEFTLVSLINYSIIFHMNCEPTVCHPVYLLALCTGKTYTQHSDSLWTTSSIDLLMVVFTCHSLFQGVGAPHQMWGSNVGTSRDHLKQKCTGAFADCGVVATDAGADAKALPMMKGEAARAQRRVRAADWPKRLKMCLIIQVFMTIWKVHKIKRETPTPHFENQERGRVARLLT